MKSYLRDDISADEIKYFGSVLSNYKVNPKDKTKKRDYFINIKRKIT